MSLSNNPAIELRLALLSGELHADVAEMHKDAGAETARKILADAARNMIDRLPLEADVGRVLAFIDTLCQAHSILGNALVLGCGDAARKKRKVAAAVSAVPKQETDGAQADTSKSTQ